jgi:hypothetical protein
VLRDALTRSRTESNWNALGACGPCSEITTFTKYVVPMVEPFKANSSPLGFGGEQAARPKAHPKIIQ